MKKVKNNHVSGLQQLSNFSETDCYEYVEAPGLNYLSYETLPLKWHARSTFFYT